MAIIIRLIRTNNKVEIVTIAIIIAAAIETIGTITGKSIDRRRRRRRRRQRKTHECSVKTKCISFDGLIFFIGIIDTVDVIVIVKSVVVTITIRVIIVRIIRTEVSEQMTNIIMR